MVGLSRGRLGKHTSLCAASGVAIRAEFLEEFAGGVIQAVCQRFLRFGIADPVPAFSYHVRPVLHILSFVRFQQAERMRVLSAVHRVEDLLPDKEEPAFFQKRAGVSVALCRLQSFDGGLIFFRFKERSAFLEQQRVPAFFEQVFRVLKSAQPLKAADRRVKLTLRHGRFCRSVCNALFGIHCQDRRVLVFAQSRKHIPCLSIVTLLQICGALVVPPNPPLLGDARHEHKREDSAYCNAAQSDHQRLPAFFRAGVLIRDLFRGELRRFFLFGRIFLRDIRLGNGFGLGSSFGLGNGFWLRFRVRSLVFLFCVSGSIFFRRHCRRRVCCGFFCGCNVPRHNFRRFGSGGAVDGLCVEDLFLRGRSADGAEVRCFRY